LSREEKKNESIHEDDTEWQNKDSFSRRAQARQDKNSRAYPKASVPSHEEQNLAQLAYEENPFDVT
jgi:hypothetical protein